MPILKICLDNVPPVSNFLHRHLHNKLTDYFLFPDNSTKIRYDKIIAIEKFKILHALLDIGEFTDFSKTSKAKEILGIPDNNLLSVLSDNFLQRKEYSF